jgi:uncharacterized delta-60 repeat protein
MTNPTRQFDEAVDPVPAPEARQRWLPAWCGRHLLPLLAGILLVGAGLPAPARAADGDLDPSFGTGGKVTTDFLIPISPGFSASGFDGATAIALQGDGKIVAAGFTSDADFNAIVALVRYNPDGSLDTGFGSGGTVPIAFFVLGYVVEDRNVVDVAIQADGKIVVVGTVGPYGSPSTFGVARYNGDGTLDASFGGVGWVTTDVGDTSGAASVAIQGDGKIVVAGWATNDTGYADFALVRYNPNGSLDTAGFGGGTGKVTTDFAGYDDFANGVAIQGDGKIVAAGASAPDATYRRDFAVARYNTDGTLDTTGFGSGTGKVTTDTTGISEKDLARAVVIQGDGRIVVAGAAVVPNDVCWCAHFAIMRYDTGGVPDPGFGAGGRVIDDFVGGGDYATDVAIQADGKIVAVGLVQDPSDIELHLDFGLARYNTDGSPDTTFGTGGKVMTPFQGTDAAQGVAIQPDCKIVAAGYTWPVENTPDGEFLTGDSNFALARYDGGVCSVSVAPCPKSQGYWKNHASGWPVTTLALGSTLYTQAELLALLGATSPNDASLILARQLIAAKLNIAGGADAAPVSGVIADADALLSGFGGKLTYKVKPGSATGKAMIADASVLDSYDQALLTPGCSP